VSGLVDIEIRLLIEAVFLRYGHDFRDYAPASMKRRVVQAQQKMGMNSISALQERVLHDPTEFAVLLQYLTVPVSEMFRDPAYFLALRRHVVPVEEGLLERTILYATDINHASLDRARQGIFRLEHMQAFTRNYQRAGGTASFSDYYTAAYGGALFDKALRDSITFADHSLATDAVFSETHLVSCRNVLIYFNRKLQDRALGLFHESLAHRGHLGLGSKETLDFSAFAERFEPVSKPERIYRKVGA
jgi:chemotaxis protein methyltransferase CheR